jgi:hypothetical protein
VGELTVGGLAAVFDESDGTVHRLAVAVDEHQLEVPDLGPPPQQVVPELVEPGADLQLERPGLLAQLAGIGLCAPGDETGQDEPWHQLAWLDHRCVVVLQQLDPAYPAREELVRLVLEFVLDVVPLRLVHLTLLELPE